MDINEMSVQCNRFKNLKKEPIFLVILALVAFF